VPISILAAHALLGPDGLISIGHGIFSTEHTKMVITHECTLRLFSPMPALSKHSLGQILEAHHPCHRD
jgi:hypothetical protein